MARQQLILDRYRVIAQAGSGGYATVYHTYDTKLNRDVAIKVIKISEADMAQARLMALEARVQHDLYDENAVDELLERGATFGQPKPGTPTGGAAASTDLDQADLPEDDSFDHIPGLAEARMVARLNHENIVTVYECEVRDNNAYILMEYVQGKTLSQIMRESKDGLSIDVIAAVFSAVAHALETAHAHQVLHFDIKPDNVIINEQGVVKVTDFGLATLVDAGGHGRAGGGTIGYMPLEQLRREPLDARCDEWALASLTYEMLSGQNPFSAPTLKAAEEALLDAELVLPSLCWDGLDARIDDVLFRALDLDPDERYETVAEFADDLGQYLGDPRRGKKQLARLVKGVEEEDEPIERQIPREPAIPLVDRIGVRGANVLARVAAAVGSLVVAWISVLNFQQGSAAGAGLAYDWAAPLWGVVALFAVAAAVNPSLGMALSFVALSAMFFSNQAYALGAATLVLTFAWWFYVARRSNAHAVVSVFQVLGGSFGFAALAPVAAGCFLTVGQAVLSTAFALFMALVFASFGSCDLMNWEVLTSAQFFHMDIEYLFVETLMMPMTWCVALSWILAAVSYSLLCAQGTRAFDIAGSVLACVILVVGVCVGAALSSETGSWLPSASSLMFALVPGLVGIAAAVGNVPDRARSV